MTETTTEITPEQGALDLQHLIDRLDQRGLLVLQVLLGQRAITLLEVAKPDPSNILKPNMLIKP